MLLTGFPGLSLSSVHLLSSASSFTLFSSPSSLSCLIMSLHLLSHLGVLLCLHQTQTDKGAPDAVALGFATMSPKVADIIQT